MEYKPRPLATSEVKLSQDIQELIERLAENTHAVWASKRLADGWKYGQERNDRKKEHPGLVPYASLSELEKEYDRKTAEEVLRAIIAFGYKIEKQ